ncbi:hypothetical protein FJQ98_25180 [Lysinibacillus agricola]|uniref:ABC transporter permease n=1 Tax=Lysinibacillus agricola TaxID=2590012 RepID=A0ABX7AQV4_9BACI|nr:MULTISPECIES: hypothetical protein [Lysinibacillus]KOS61642.1 hypothetical protein AN161_16800 [Lysinibacillus sp. FJAT-14222]QQP12343.1 hypothetical protein FJQ98_25180 [Lysinibacillus agricola]
MSQYSIGREIAYKLKFRNVLIWLFIMCLPIIYYLAVRDSYEFKDSLQVFSFMVKNMPIFFTILATLIYLPLFSAELKNRFLVYTRLRMPIKKLLFIKFSANFLLSFSVFFIYIFSLFSLCFYIFPSLGLAHLQPEAYNLNEITVQEDAYTRFTFTQLLEYGSLTYGLIYSFWVGINAAIYASIGFLLLLIVPNKFVAMSIPTLIFFVGSYLLDRPFQLLDAVFPYNYIQQPIWTAVTPFIGLCCLCLCLFLYIRKKFDYLDDLI